ncbi:unnamed protein product [Owenia fusiformis]|uniref:VWFA domain-containing protein n=1 Tax=Owenia fusiformis TaxID=6347 RepID=A0A8S4NWN5_OWEFU|nr:unnamed protein product [Owenia fusiformis]
MERRKEELALSTDEYDKINDNESGIHIEREQNKRKMKLLIVCLCAFPLVQGGYKLSLSGKLGRGASHSGNKQGQSEAIDRPGCQGATRKYAPVDINGLKKCQFYECDGVEYLMRVCPDGMGVTQSFGSKITSGQYPCVASNPKCKRSLLEKGIGDIEINVCGVDLAFVIDVSCSLAKENKEKVKDFVLAITRRLPVRPAFTQIAGVSYAKTVYPLLHFNSATKQKDVMNLLRQNLRTEDLAAKDCGTATYLALQAAREELFNKANGDRPERKNVVILMTDGRSYPAEDAPKAIAAAKALKDDGAIINVVTLPNLSESTGTPEEVAEKKKLAEMEFSAFPSSPKNRWDLKSFEDLDTIVNELTSMSCYKM